MRGIHSNFRRGFLTILDDVLTVGEFAVREERADRLILAQKGAGGGMGNRTAADVAKRSGSESSKKCAKIAGAYVEQI